MFDKEISIRSIAASMVIGWLLRHNLPMSPEFQASLSVVIAGIVGMAYDWVMFKLKLKKATK